jgi:plastocyanin
MTKKTLATLRAIMLTAPIVLNAARAGAEEPVALSIAIKDHQFDPAEIHVPAGKPIALTVKNLGSIAAEFESSVLHVEKVIPAGGEAVIHVRPLEAGRYGFFDDFHRQTQGLLLVP